jgi:hypothetical protein
MQGTNSLFRLSGVAGLLFAAVFTTGSAHAATVSGAHDRFDTLAYSSTSCSTTKYYNSSLGFNESVPSHNLYEGDYGDYCVKSLQWGIDYLYGSASQHYPIAIDGDYGNATYTYVKKFQSDHPSCAGISDGVAGAQTNSCLNYYTGVYNY